jgi:hypothetical protein
MRWEWENCPKSLAGQYSGKTGMPTMVLEAIFGPDLHASFATFGHPGSLNDLNIFNRSPLITDILEDRLQCRPYEINGVSFDKYYLLADGIYPSWDVFVKTFSHQEEDFRCLSRI